MDCFFILKLHLEHLRHDITHLRHDIDSIVAFFFPPVYLFGFLFTQICTTKHGNTHKQSQHNIMHMDVKLTQSPSLIFTSLSAEAVRYC